MVSLLVLYGTDEGQTAKVAARIADRLRDRGHDATVADAEEASADLSADDFDAVLVGASIHVGRHQTAVEEFVRGEREALGSRPTAFFQLSLSTASAEESRQAEAAGYVEEFVAATDWHPDRIGLFGGALRYSRYGFLKRLMLKQIARKATGDTDTSRDYEYTDWDEVDDFADDFAAFVEGRLGIAPPETEPGERRSGG